jgi:hypothetical protein
MKGVVSSMDLGVSNEDKLPWHMLAPMTARWNKELMPVVNPYRLEDLQA